MNVNFFGGIYRGRRTLASGHSLVHHNRAISAICEAMPLKSRGFRDKALRCYTCDLQGAMHKR